MYPIVLRLLIFYLQREFVCTALFRLWLTNDFLGSSALHFRQVKSLLAALYTSPTTTPGLAQVARPLVCEAGYRELDPRGLDQTWGCWNNLNMKVLGLVSLGRPSGDPKKWRSFLLIAYVLTVSLIDLVTVFDAILTSRQTGEKLQCFSVSIVNVLHSKDAINSN